MTVKSLVKTSEYHDSVSLMIAARELSRLPGVLDAAIVMGTEANKGLLREAGLLTPEAQSATPNDLVIAVRAGAESQAASALAKAGRLLQKKTGSTGSNGDGSGGYRPRTLRGGVKAQPETNVAVISVAGRYAAREAWEALHLGLHVLLFSDNVSIEDEVALKQYAVQKNLLLMGPGAGTAILNGVALGFADVVPHGSIGVVSAAGTGLQEVTSLLAKRGAGITQGIGTGGRDLKEVVGGLMMLAGLRALQEDPATERIILVSKPPSPGVAQKILDQVAQSAKPTVVCFLGGAQNTPTLPHTQFASTLQEAVLLATLPEGKGEFDMQAILNAEDQQLDVLADSLRPRLQPVQCDLRGLFSGGTLCYEAQVIWKGLLARPVLSNAPLDPAQQMPDSNRSHGHTAVDLGEEEFTVGRPHPMIDNDLRIRRILQEAADPSTAVIVLDVVLGYGAHPDPASELAPAVARAHQLAVEAGRELLFIASVTGTAGDPQDLDRQVSALEAAGVIVCSCNAAAARLAAKVVS